MGREGGRGCHAGRADLFAAHVGIAGGIQGEELEHHAHVAGEVLGQLQRLGIEIAAMRAVVVAEHDHLYRCVGGTDTGRVRERELLRGAAQVERGGAEGAGRGTGRPAGEADGAGLQAQRGAGSHDTSGRQGQRRRTERGSRTARLASSAGRAAGAAAAPQQHREQHEGHQLQCRTVQAQRLDNRCRDHQQGQRRDRGQPAQGGRDIQIHRRQAAELAQQWKRQQDTQGTVHGQRHRRDRNPRNSREPRLADPVAVHVARDAATAHLAGHDMLEVVVGQNDGQQETGNDQQQRDPSERIPGSRGRRCRPTA